MSKKLIIIDGNSIANRAFYGIRMLTNKDGLATNAVYGFLNIMFKYIDELSPDCMCVAFDLSAPTFRHKMYSEYKANRKGMPDDLRVQMPVLKQVLGAMNIAILEKEGYEADDIIGTVASKCEEGGYECIIVTGDRDDLQLASGKTKIYLTTTSMGATKTDIYDDKAVFDKYGVTPTEFIDVKALMGDSSDNIPGVAGIGEKTALTLITNNKSIENIYGDIENCGAKGATLQKLKDGRDSAFISKELATIDRNVPVDFSFDAVKVLPYNNKELYELLTMLEFKSIIKKLDLTEEQSATALTDASNVFEGREFILASGFDDVLVMKKHILAEKQMTYRLYTFEGQISAIAAGTKDKIYYVPTGFGLSAEWLMDTVKELFENKDVLKTGHNVKDDIVMLNSYGVKYDGLCFDTAIGAYILQPQKTSYPLSELAEEFLGVVQKSEEDFFGKGKTAVSVCDIDEKDALEYCAREVCITNALKKYISAELEKNNQNYLYYEVELPLVMALADMQIVGMQVDKSSLSEFNRMLSGRIGELTEQIYALADEEFNINSTKQLGEVLFEKIGLKPIKKTKTGYSTNAEVLEKLQGEHPIIDLIIEYRLISKIKSTYGDGLLAVINPTTNRIHSSFNQTVTVTGRISSTEPNMQNIPVRHPLGREIRKMFVAKEGCQLVDADYSQIELRVLAHIANDEVMKKAFADDVDIHALTASQVLHIPASEVTQKQRSDAKAVNFGIVYGIGEFSLSKDIGVSVYEARKYIDSYLEHYSGVKEYMEKIKEEAKESGYVTTLLGRRRYIPELRSSNFNLRAFGERVALNTPIQGTAADIIKIAMVRVYKRLKDENLKSKLILQVHDELIVEAYEDELETVKKLLKEEMENAYKLDVSLIAEEKHGKSWYETK